MKRIVLNTLCVEGFRSYTEPTVITFTGTAGLKFISGDNQVEITLESNGAGKSTVFDAISWILYGYSVKGLRASELMSYGHQSMQGMLILDIDDGTVAVERTSPPNRLTIDGQPVEQDAVDRLVGMSRIRFLHSVIYGQGVPLFIDLSVPQRGDLLDDVLGLEVWLRAATVATDRHSALTGNLTQLQLNVQRIQGSLEGLPDIPALEEQEQQWQADRDARLGELIECYEAVEAEIKATKEKLPAHVVTTVVTEARERHREQRAIVADLEQQRAVKQSAHDRLVAEIEWFRDKDTCPTCTQKIGAKFSRDRRTENARMAGDLNIEIAETMRKIVTASEKAEALEQRWHELVKAVEADNAARERVVASIAAAERESHSLQQQAIRTRNETNPYTALRQRAVADRFRLRASLSEQQEAVTKAQAEMNAYNFWRQAFRRCRLFCLDNVLRELTLETRNSLVALGLTGWGVNYTTATETKSGTMRLGVQVEIEPPGERSGSFNVLSGGEGQRARIAASLGLGNLIQRWAGVSWNTEIWDEPTAWLSGRGVENLLDSLVYRAAAQDKSILLADHRSLAHSGFAETYLVTKTGQGSHWEQV